MHRLADWRSEYVRDVRQAWAAALVLLFPLPSLVSGFGVGLAGFLFLATALCWWRAGWRLLRAHWPRTRWVLLAFLGHFALAALLALARGEGAAALETPARMCLMAAAMLVVQVARPALRALWLGAAGGALGGLAFAGWQRFALGWAQPGGLMDPSMFGDLSLCLALLALAGAGHAGTPPLRRIAMAGVAAGLAASLLAASPAPTPPGVRLASWKAGWMLAREHPWTGLDAPAYGARMRAWAAQGRLSGTVSAPPHLHNDALQALVTRGVPGLLAWSATLLAPLAFFAGRLRRTRRGGAQRAAAVAGLSLVLAYAGFGLVEAIFRSMQASLFYALTVFLLMGWCLSSEYVHPAPDEGGAARVRGAGLRTAPPTARRR